MSKSDIQIKAFDLFCSVGGLTYGLQKSGIEVTGGLDIDKSCKYAYEHNCKAIFLSEDIRDIHYRDIAHFLKNADCRIIVGCAPCQPFSTHAFKIQRSRNDAQWNLINELARIVKEGMPEIVSMENVPNLEKETVFEEFLKTLRKLGYFVDYRIIKCDLLGVPQSRKRLVLLASLFGTIKPPRENSFAVKSVRDAIGHLPKIGHGDTCLVDRLHKSSALASVNIERIRSSIPGGTWRDWPEFLLPHCYRKPSGRSYRSVYGRMEWDKPSPTLTTQFYRYGTGRYGHPEQDRALSLREGALLQTFPENYEFIAPQEPINFSNIGRYIGNAVPPFLAQAIGQSILEHLEYYG